MHILKIIFNIVELKMLSYDFIPKLLLKNTLIENTFMQVKTAHI